MSNTPLALIVLDGLIAATESQSEIPIQLSELKTLRLLLQPDTDKTVFSVTGLRPVKMGLFPTMGSLQQVHELALSQLPYNTPNAITGLLMTFQNTLLEELKKE